MTSVLAVFFLCRVGRYWHKASFAAPKDFWALLGAQQTNQSTGPD